MDFKKIEKMTERRCIARKKIQEVAQELYDFAKENAIEIANTKEMKEWIIKQIHLIKNEDNFEEEFLKEIKEMLNRH